MCGKMQLNNSARSSWKTLVMMQQLLPWTVWIKTAAHTGIPGPLRRRREKVSINYLHLISRPPLPAHLVHLSLQLNLLLIAHNDGFLIRLLALLLNNIRVQIELLLIDPLEHKPEHHRAHRPRNRGPRKRPDQIRVLDRRRGPKRNGRRYGRHEEIEGRDDALHVLRRLAVGDRVGRDVAQDLGERRDHDGDGVVANGDGGDGRGAIGHEIGADARIMAAGRGLVDVVLQDREAHGADCAHGEAGGDARDGAPVDTVLAEKGVEDVVHEWDGWRGGLAIFSGRGVGRGLTEDNSDWIQVIKQVVGHALRGHAGT